MQDKELTYSLEAEQSVLGGMLCNPDIRPFIKNILDVSDFYIEKHQVIYKAILDSGKKDITSIWDLIDAARVEKKYYMGLCSVTVSAGWKNHCEIVKKNSDKRKIWHLGQTLCEEAIQTFSDIDNIISMAKSGIIGIENNRSDSDDYSNEDSYMKTYSNATENRLPGFYTGLDGLGERFYFEKDYIHCIAGESGISKSSLALRIGDYISWTYGPVDYYTFESSRARLNSRQLAKYSRVPLTRINKSNYTSDDQIGKLQKAIDRLCKSSMKFFDDPKLMEIERLCTYAETRALKYKTKAIIIDYLQMAQSINKKLDSRKALVENALFHLKALAKNINVPVIYVCQLRKDIKDKPTLDDLYESNAIRQATDNIIFIYSPFTHEMRIKNPIYPVEIYSLKCKDQELFSEWQEFNGHFQDFSWCDVPDIVLMKKKRNKRDMEL